MDPVIPQREAYVLTRESARLAELRKIKKLIADEFAKHPVAPDAIYVVLESQPLPDNMVAIGQWLAEGGYAKPHMGGVFSREAGEDYFKLKITI